MHDPDKGPQVRAAGVKARTERPASLLTDEQAAELVKLESAAELPETVERVARMAVAGRLDPRLANLVLQAASIAQRGHEPAQKEWERLERKAAAQRRAAWEATPEGQEELARRRREYEASPEGQAFAALERMGLSMMTDP